MTQVTKVVKPNQSRSRLMARVRTSGTSVELDVRKRLWAAGFRYARRPIALVGKPDLVFPSLRAAVFVHGCFWHGHGCPRGALPKTNIQFWEVKIQGNRARDKRVIRHLRSEGWLCVEIWACEIERGCKRTISRLSRRRRELS